MTKLLAVSPFGNYQSMRRFSVKEYHRMIETGILDETDKVELLEGYVVLKMPRNPPHDSTIQRVQRRIGKLLPDGWDLRIQSAITLSDSEPEPDILVVRGDESLYRSHHPGPRDAGLVIEVADSSRDRDREKARVYGSAEIEVYWIVNLIDQQVEVFTLPSGPGPSAGYARRVDHGVGDVVPFSLDGGLIATVAVSDLLP